MSTTYTNQMGEAFTLTKEFQASAHYGTGIKMFDLTATQSETIGATAVLPAITGAVVTLDSAAARTFTSMTDPSPVGQQFTLLNGNTITANTFTITDGDVFDCGGRGNVVLQPGEKIVLVATGLTTCRMVSTTA